MVARFVATMIVAVHNPKGGVGKTTTAVNLAAAGAKSGRRVLLVDLDATANASISLGARPESPRPSITDVLLNPILAPKAVRQVTGLPNLHLITSSTGMTQMETALRHVRQPDRRLGDAIRPLQNEYDAVILDTPPGFSLITMNALSAAQHLIVPVSAEYLAIEALAHFLRWYQNLRRDRSGLARLLGIVLTMVDYRAPATREIVDILRAHNRGGVCETEIPRDPRAAEAPSHGLPLVLYARRSRATIAYARFDAEIQRRLRRRSA